MSALIVVNVFYFLRELGIVQWYAGLTALLFAIGSPVYIYSSMLFIEPIAALAVLYAMRVLCRPVLSRWRLVVASAGLGVLPWVHGRFTLFSVVIGGLLAWRVWRVAGRAGVWRYALGVLPVLVLVLGYEVYNVVVWHSLNPAPGNANVGNGVFQVPVYKGFLGITLDRSFGVIPNFPLFALVLPGVLLAMRRGLNQLNAAIAVVVVPYLLVVSTFSQWYAGYSPPARYIAAVAPLLSYYVAVTLQRLHNWLVNTGAVLLALFSASLSVIGDVLPTTRFNWPEWPQGQAMQRLGDLLGIRFVRYVPSSFLTGQAGMFAVWALGLAVGTAIIWYIGWRQPASRTPDWPVRLVERRGRSGPADAAEPATG
ncbi:MAG TPA: hypothetical protein VFE14_18795 [Micromonosporaceae bacterium]|nr:hypothetical protein [Micromonosporaceae bacterium]